MPSEVTGGGERQPWPPQNPTTIVNEVPYTLTIPLDNEPANVPGDLERLAEEIIRELNLRLTEQAAEAAYQGKIFISPTKPVGAGVTALEQDCIVFVFG